MILKKRQILTDFDKLIEYLKYGKIRKRRKSQLYKNTNLMLWKKWTEAKDHNKKRFIESLILKLNTPFFSSFYVLLEKELSKNLRDQYFTMMPSVVRASLNSFNPALGSFIVHLCWNFKSYRTRFYKQIEKQKKIEDSINSGENKHIIEQIQIRNNNDNNTVHLLLKQCQLTKKEENIILLYYRDNLTLKQIGDIYNKSNESIRQKKRDIINKIKSENEKYK